MKTKNNITKSIVGTLPIALLAAGLALGPLTASAQAHGGGGGGGSFGGHGGGSFGGHGGGSFGGHGGGSFGGHGGATFGGNGGATFTGRGSSFAPAMPEHSGPAFTGRQPNFAPAEHAPAIANGRTATVPNSVNRRAALANIDSRMSRLDARFAAGRVGDDARRHHDRIRRTRDLLVGFVDLGTPDWEIGEWCDALWQDDIVAGMPASLVFDYWGNPIATESIVLDGVPAGVWTYHLQSGHTARITVANGVVRSVQEG